MKKIGLFLTAAATGGGMYQYSLSILAALMGLPNDEFQLVVAYVDPKWTYYLSPDRVVHLPVRMGSFAEFLAKFWVTFGCPFDTWYRWTPQFHPVVRDVVLQKCDLWVFPRQDIWSSQFPVNSLAAIHDLMHRYEAKFPEVSSFGRHKYRDTYIRQTCGSARGILVDSELGRRQVHESYQIPLEKLHVLPYIAPHYVFEKQAREEDVLTKYGLPDKYLLYPAQFWAHKNHDRLIRALVRVKKDLPDARLVLVGSKRNRYSELHRLVEELKLNDEVLFLGHVPDCDMPDLYRSARGLIFPTFFGPTNIPPLEAFALGCPVAASNIYAMPEQLGDAALLFNPSSIDEIAHSIRSLWTDHELCGALIAKGHAKAESWGQQQFDRAVQRIVRQVVN